MACSNRYTLESMPCEIFNPIYFSLSSQDMRSLKKVSRLISRNIEQEKEKKFSHIRHFNTQGNGYGGVSLLRNFLESAQRCDALVRISIGPYCDALILFELEQFLNNIAYLDFSGATLPPPVGMINAVVLMNLLPSGKNLTEMIFPICYSLIPFPENKVTNWHCITRHF